MTGISNSEICAIIIVTNATNNKLKIFSRKILVKSESAVGDALVLDLSNVSLTYYSSHFVICTPV